VHVFDPASGENLTRDAEAGAELTRMAEEDREEQIADSAARNGAGPGSTGAAPAGATGAHAAGAA